MAEDLQLHGLKGLLTTLRGLPDEVRGKPLRTGMRKGGNIIRDEARNRVVKHSGFLASEIVVRRANARNRRRAGVGKDGEYFTVGVRVGRKAKYSNTKRNQRLRRVGKVYETTGWAHYWRHVEFGTKKMAAKPFLTPSAEARGPQAAQAIINETWIAITRALKRQGWVL